MKLTKEQKSNEEIVQSVDVELNEEQLELVAGGIVDDGSGGGCTEPFIKFKNLSDIILPPAPGDYESI